MKSLQFILLILCFNWSVKAQKVSLEGTVNDTLNEPLIGATVMLLQAKDSVLAKFGITNEKGKFKLEKVSPDEYILQISYLGYTNLSQPFTASELEVKQDLGAFQLSPVSALLEEVEVKADYVPIRMKKDTIEYNAAAFKTKPNAVVEDLLKKLPGVEVDRNGDIKAQGENVQKVLVDGKEFFGNDPKIATKNLPADAIDKVQVFDKKSDIAEFSGIDDGREAKTINLSLKEDKKKGYFGRVRGGYGTEERYENKFNINRFGSNIQFSSLGMFNNTNQQGFSINDYINMLGGLNNLLSSGGEISLNGDDLGLPLDTGQKNQGFTTTNAGGINLNWELNKKTKLHSSYFYNGLNKRFDLEENQESLLGENSFQSTKTASVNRKNKGHRANFNLTSKVDSFQTIKWRTNIGLTNSNNSSGSFLETFNLANVLENNSTQNISTKADNFSWNTNLTYLKRFKKKGRFFTTNIAFEKQQKEQLSELEAMNVFFENNLNNTTILQTHDTENKQTNYGVGLTYTEPLGKSKYLELNYAFQNYHTDLNKAVFDKNNSELIFNTLLSNQFQRDYLYHRAGLNYKWTAKKIKLNAGLTTQNASLKGRLLLNNVTIKKDFFNLLPKGRLTYDFKPTKSLRFDYRTTVREPSIEQLQPIIDNSDPLNIYQGNPDLIPEYLNDFRLNFNSFDQFSTVSIFASLEATFTNHKILYARTVDDQFRQTIQPINFEKDQRIGSYLSFGAPLKFLASKLNLTANYDVYNGNYLVNGFNNPYNRKEIRLGGNLSNKNIELIEILVGYKWSGNKVAYDLEVQQNQSYNRQLFYTELTLKLADSWTIGSVIDYSKYSNASFGAATDIAIWQAGIEYHFLAKKRGTLKISGHDLLNQNIGINRISQLNFLQEQRIQSLGRYFLLSFSYALSGFGNESGIEVVKRR